MQNLLNNLKTLLSKEEKYISEGILLKNVIIEDTLKLEPSLLKLLLSDNNIKKHFFQDIDGVFVFDKIHFQKFISNKQFLPDSYTAFKNKIGLTTGNEYISEKKDVVLSWPYKDCVLEGGQDKEDAKRNELFWNETLAPDEIDRLLSPKVLTNWKKYDKNGEHTVEDVSDNDNLIIKGNNLLSLSSILKKYRGKVKLIYIDPPYNTGNDEFKYNDTFNHSAWLSFMKDRLKFAKDLLTADGSIFVQLDYNESHYCKILCDSIFGEDNFVNEIIWRRKGGSALGKMNRLSCASDSILWYRKSESFNFNIVYFPASDEYIKKQFRHTDSDGRKYMVNVMRSPNPRKNLMYDYKGYKMPPNGWAIPKETMEKMDKEGRLHYPDSKDKQIYKKIYLDEYPGQQINSLWTDISTLKGNNKEILSFTGQKPESLIKRIIELASNENDIVLDFYAGTGTTGSVSHKLNRRYILVEQMNYVNSITIKRIRNVIGESGTVQSELIPSFKYDQTGISQEVNWKGGGSFLYCELAKANQEYIDNINDSKDLKELKTFWKVMQEKSFISYNVDIKTINDNFSEFDELSLEDQKRFLIEILDKNMLYVPYSEIEDTDYQISDEDKKLNKLFYGAK